VGLVLIFVAVMNVGALAWGSFAGKTAHYIEQYDIRPFLYGGREAQIWMVLGTHWACGLLALTGLVLVVVGIAGRRASRHRFLWVMAPVVASVGLVAFTFTVYEPSPHGGIPVLSLDGLERLMHVQFPPGTRLVEARALFGLDPMRAAVITMPRPALLPFVNDSFPAAAVTRYGKQPVLHVSRSTRPEMSYARSFPMADWHPERPRKFLAASVSAELSSLRAELLADLDAPDVVTVYLLQW